MTGQERQSPWERPGWFEEVAGWVRAELARLGIEAAGAIEEVHRRPWSAVLRVPAAGGYIYFKATGPAEAHEVALVEALSRWRVDGVAPLLATDLGRGWLLLADGGARLREIIRADRDLGHWEALLPRYAELQIELAGRVHELLALGLPDRRLETLPAQYDALLEDTGALGIGQPEGLTADEYRHLRERAPRFAALCAELAGYGVPETLNHGDFHDGNIFVRDGRYHFIDWGDSCVSHPFYSLRTTLVSVEISLGLAEDAPELDRLRDAYLEPWGRQGRREDLLAAFRLARRLAPVNGALTWYLTVASLEESARREYTRPVPALLREFLEYDRGGPA